MPSLFHLRTLLVLAETVFKHAGGVAGIAGHANAASKSNPVS